MRFLVSTSYYSYDPVSVFTASGHTILTDQFINFSPYIGYRINAKKINIDLMPGLDLGFCVNSHEDGDAVATDGTNNVYKTDLKRTTPSADLRLKFGAAAIYKKWGIVASFAHGLSNYTSQPLNDSSVDYKAKSELITLGFSYRIF